MSYRILVVDDIFVNRLLLTEILKQIPATCAEADNGKKAIELLEKEHFDAIFMDIEMPVMNGLETTRFIRDKLAYPKNKTPIIALTAHNPQNFFTDFMDSGFDELITKPYSIDKISKVVKNICNPEIKK